MTRSICAFPHCGRAAHSNGLCKSHDQQKRRGGTVTTLRPLGGTIPREEAFWSNVKKGAGCWEWTAFRDKEGYGRFGRGGRNDSKALAHRYSWEITRGPIPQGMQIDHRCHNPACVNPEHLRVVTNKQNCENRKGADVDSRTGVRGVSWDSKNNKYRVLVTHEGRPIHGGRFKSLQEAAEAAKQLRLSLFTHNDIDRKAA